MAVVNSTGWGSNAAIMGIGLTQDEFSNDNQSAYVRQQNCQEYGHSCDPVPKTSPTFVDSLVQQNITSSRTYSLWMDGAGKFLGGSLVQSVAADEHSKTQPPAEYFLAATILLNIKGN